MGQRLCVSRMKAVDVPTFATSQLSLLSDELEAETEETALLTSTHAPSTLARAGLAILNLSVSSQRTGLGGKTLLDLELDPAVAGASKELPEHGIRVGDIVGVAEQPKGAERKKEREGLEKKGVTGVVVKVQKESVVVALDKEDVDVPGGKLWLWVVRLLDVTGELSWLICTAYIESSWQTMLRTKGRRAPINSDDMSMADRQPG